MLLSLVLWDLEQYPSNLTKFRFIYSFSSKLDPTFNLPNFEFRFLFFSTVYVYFCLTSSHLTLLHFLPFDLSCVENAFWYVYFWLDNFWNDFFALFSFGIFRWINTSLLIIVWSSARAFFGSFINVWIVTGVFFAIIYLVRIV